MNDRTIGERLSAMKLAQEVLNFDRRRELLLARAGARRWAADAVTDILLAPEGDEALAIGELARRLDERTAL